MSLREGSGLHDEPHTANAGGDDDMAPITLDITMSLDGFVAGPEPSMEDPLGKRGMELHEWAFRLASWRQAHGMEGGENGPDSDLVAEHVASYGAVVMGRRMYSGGAGPWEDDPNADGWWGDDPPFHVPVFVLTHHARESREMQGGTTFHFVTDGIDAALDRAQEAAGDKTVHVAGGAAAVQQVLAAGRFDELTVHVAPVLLGSGTRLFENVDGCGVKLEVLPAPASPAVTHVRYRVVG
jgi:dihydrofolate reductase